MPPEQSQRELIEVKGREIDYTLLRKIASECGGFVRSSGPGGTSAEVWHDDKVYVFTGEGLIEFLFALKDYMVDRLYKARDLCEYIAKSKTTPPSVFVRDAIAAKAAELFPEEVA